MNTLNQTARPVRAQSRDAQSGLVPPAEQIAQQAAALSDRSILLRTRLHRHAESLLASRQKLDAAQMKPSDVLADAADAVSRRLFEQVGELCRLAAEQDAATQAQVAAFIAAAGALKDSRPGQN